ncbi:MAG: hypothetical protein JNK12_19515 [Acidimicrobiales bacterium]|nr:hypothetical protein [Acidimicrobiales bacterium]
MSRLTRIAAVAVCLLVLFGCSSSDDSSSSSSETTASSGGGSAGGDFADELNSVCAEGKQAVDAAAGDLTSALDEVRAATSADEFQAAVADLQSAAEAAGTALTDFASSIEALDIPADAADAVDSYTQALQQQVDVAQQIADSDTTSVAAIDETLTSVQEDDGAARQALSQAADELGAGSCAPSTPNTASTGAGATTTTAAN